MDPTASKLLRLVASEWGSSRPSLPFFPMDGQLFLFPQHRRNAYLKGLESLLNSPLTENDAFISAFVKCEKIDVLQKDGDPRMIQARSIRWNLELGRYTRKVEKDLYKLEDRVGLPLIAKGRNPTQRAYDLSRKWAQFNNPVALSLDLSRWDMHVRKGMLLAVREFYLKIMPSEQLAWLTANMIVNKGRTANGALYRRADGVTSGDMTTALGNCLAVCLMLRSLRVIRNVAKTNFGVKRGKKSVPLFGTNKEWRTLVDHLEMTEGDFIEYDDGDDHTFMCEKEDAEHYADALAIWYKLCGHKLTVEGITDRFEDIIFCQSKPLYCGGELRMVSDPRKVLAAGFMVPPTHLTSKRCVETYLSEVFLGRAIVHAGEPYVGPMFEKLSKRYGANPKCLNSANFRMQLGGLWYRTNMLGDIGEVRSYVGEINRRITSEENALYCDLWGMTHEEMCFLTDGELPDLGGPKRSTFHCGNPVELSIDTITEWGIVTRNI